MTGQAAEVDVVAGLAGAERDVGAGTLAGDVGRTCGRLLIGEDDVVFGAFAIDQGNLHALPFGSGQYRIDLAIDRAADADKDHAAFGNPSAQRIAQARNVAGRGLVADAGGVALRGAGARARLAPAPRAAGRPAAR